MERATEMDFSVTTVMLERFVRHVTLVQMVKLGSPAIDAMAEE